MHVFGWHVRACTHKLSHWDKTMQSMYSVCISLLYVSTAQLSDIFTLCSGCMLLPLLCITELIIWVAKHSADRGYHCCALLSGERLQPDHLESFKPPHFKTVGHSVWIQVDYTHQGITHVHVHACKFACYNLLRLYMYVHAAQTTLKLTLKLLYT